MTKPVFIVLLLCFLSAVHADNATEPAGLITTIDWLQVDDDFLHESLLVWEDSGEEDEPAQVWASFSAQLERGLGGWINFDRDYPGELHKIVTLWGGVRVKNPGQETLQLVLSNKNLTTQDTSVFIYRQGLLISEESFGVKHKRSEQKIKYRYFVQLLEIPAGETRDILLRVRVAGLSRTVLNATALRPQSVYLFADNTSERISWLYYGAMLLLGGMSFVSAVLLRSGSFALFSLFAISGALMQMTLEGYTGEYLWSENLWIKQYAFIIFGALMFASGLEFSTNFLELAIKYPRVHRFCRGASILIIAMTVIGMVHGSTYIYLFFFLGMIIWWASLVVILVVCVKSWRKGDLVAKWFVLAWSIFVVMNIMFGVSSFIFDDFYDVTWKPGNFSQLFLVAVLFAALIQKLRSGELERDRALAESKAKSDFLAKMSHEIRTPMNGVLGMAELLADTKLDKTQHYYTNVIYNSGRTLLNVINEILDYSKIAAGKMQLEAAEFNLSNVGQECVSLFLTQSREKKLELIFRMDPDMPRVWLGDETRVRQIIVNLLGNAFKFTDAGEVLLMIEALEDQSGISISIADSGIGITEQQQSGLFQDFAQADASTSRKYGGTGLGLTICKQLVEMMGGEIGFDSRYGIGSTFWLNLPLSPASTRELSAIKSDDSLSGCRLLLVDDNETYRKVVVEQLARRGLDIHEAENGLVALEMLTDLEAREESYDLISVDIDMPVMDGISLAKALCARPEDYKVIMLSATTQLPMPDEYRKWDVMLAAQKPILAEDLYTLFSKALGTSVEEAAVMPEVTSSTEASSVVNRVSGGGSYSVLVAEDNEVNFQVAGTMLRKLGHSVQRAHNGLEAVNQFKAHNLNARAAAFDLIFMDCEMPEMDGFEAARAIRQMEAERQMAAIPIVALTAHASGDRLDLCTDAGMNSYLSKPVQLKTLRTLMDSLRES